MRRPEKSWALLLVVILLGGLLWSHVLWWQFGISYGGVLPPWVYTLNALIWSITFLAGFYQLGLRLASSIRSPEESSMLLELRGQNVVATRAPPVVSLVYLTCDDFMPEALEGVLGQEGASYNIIIGNDSRDDAVKSHIEEIVAAVSTDRRGKVMVRHWSLERADSDVQSSPIRNGKSKNLNMCIADLLSPDDRLGDWLVVLDADTIIPRDYIATLSQVARVMPADVGLIQGRSDPRMSVSEREIAPDLVHHVQTPFQRAVAPEVDIIYRNELPSRARHGFVPFMGHSGAIRKQALLKLLMRPDRRKEFAGRPFPDFVSEDFAISVELRREGFQCAYVEELVSHEPGPVDIDAYLVRVHKLAGGAAEALINIAVPFLFGTRHANRVSLLERLDSVFLLLWAALAPAVLFNLFLSGIVAGAVWQETSMPLVHEALLYTIAVTSLAAMLIPFAGCRSVSEGFTSSLALICVYLLSTPIAAAAFVRALLIRPRFVVTPKCHLTSRATRSPWIFAKLLLLAFAAITIAVVYESPFSPVLLASGAAFLSLPALRVLSREDVDDHPWLGVLAWCVVSLPGALLIAGLVTMWQWRIRSI